MELNKSGRRKQPGRIEQVGKGANLIELNKLEGAKLIEFIKLEGVLS